jgi:hypothetical protein
MTYLNLQSLELALRAGLGRHELYKQGKLAKQPRPAPLYPEQIALLKRNEIDRGRCVECHMIGDYQAQEAELAGKLDRPSMLHPSPDLKTIGIHRKKAPGGPGVQRKIKLKRSRQFVRKS